MRVDVLSAELHLRGADHAVELLRHELGRPVGLDVPGDARRYEGGMRKVLLWEIPECPISFRPIPI